VDTSNTSNYEWILDSAATEHLTGYKDDFNTPIKPWNRLHTVEIANGELIDVYGYGDIQIRTNSGSLLLKNTWYAPDFECRLISVSKLDSESYNTTFRSRKARITYNGQLIFEGPIIKGLYPLLNGQFPTNQRCYISNSTNHLNSTPYITLRKEL
jgi:hypothetical protein